MAILMTVLFILLGTLHIYWAVGGKRGIDKALPVVDEAPAIAPGLWLTLFVALALFICGFVIFKLGVSQSTTLFLEGDLVYLGWFLSAIFTLRAIGDFHLVGFFKKIKTSLFSKYDTFIYSPLCVMLGIGFGLASLNL